MPELQRQNRHGIINRWLLPLAPIFSVAAMLAYSLWSFLLPASDGYFHVECLCRRLSGLPCPYCGFTRSMTSLYGGNIYQAFLFHPFALLWLGFLLYLSVVFVRRSHQSPHLMRSIELQLFAWLFAASWAAKLLVGPAYY